MTTHEAILSRLAELRATAEAAVWAHDHAAADDTYSDLKRHREFWSPTHSLRWIEWAEQVASRHVHTTERRPRSPFNELTGEPQGPDFEVTCDVCGWAGNTEGALCPDMRGLAGALGLEET